MQLTENGIVIACERCGQRNRLKFEKLRETFRCGKCQANLSAPASPLDVADDRSFFAALAGSTMPLLVDFWAPWCGPCKMVAPEVEKFAAEVAGRVLVLKINTEESPMLAQRYGINSIPTFVLFDKGEPVARQAGAMSAVHLKRFASGVL
ncbi:MAG: thioredoxin [Limisphaerales bacterium]